MLFRVLSAVGLGMGEIVEWDEADREKVTYNSSSNENIYQLDALRENKLISEVEQNTTSFISTDYEKIETDGPPLLHIAVDDAL